MEREAPSGKIYPEEYARPFIPLKTEIKEFSLGIPRTGRYPRIASLKLTDNCQKNCNYCDANEAKGKPMELKEIFNVQRNLKEAGIQMLDLTGGEPTLRDDLPDIIKHSKELGITITTLSTNGGINKDYDYWHRLAEAGLFGATFSYDGVGEKTIRELFI